jgi:hypothetical protein
MKSDAEGEREKEKKTPHGGRRNEKVPRHQTSRPIQSENPQKSRKPQKKKKVLLYVSSLFFSLPHQKSKSSKRFRNRKRNKKKPSNDFQFLTGC